MGQLVPRPGMKLMWMVPGDHRIYCDEKHRPASALGPYQEQFAESANCWMCLREIDTSFKTPNKGSQDPRLSASPDIGRRPRIWFKEDMAKAILNGRKTSTTRDHSRNVGTYLAVMGDRYHARPFATISITAVEETTWARVFQENWREEGFNSPGHMKDWCESNGLAKPGKVFLHRFVVNGVPHILKSTIGDGT